MKVIEQEHYAKIFDAVNPLDRRNGRIPSWFEVVAEVGLEDCPRGMKKLFQSFYRGHRAIAIGKEVRGRRLIQRLTRRREFEELEREHPEKLNKIVDVVNKRVL